MKIYDDLRTIHHQKEDSNVTLPYELAVIQQPEIQEDAHKNRPEK